MAQPFEPTRGINFLVSDDPSLMTLLSGTVYSKLVEVKAGTGTTGVEIVPDLATDWQISDDGLTYTFNLRPDVRWQKIAPVDGRPFTADDVVATFTGLKASQSPHKWMVEPMDSVRAEGDHRVIFTLNQPYAPFLEYLAFHFNVVLPREGVEGKFDMSKDAIGTGPFMLADHKRNVEWVLQRNPDYYQQGKPYLDEIRLPIISDSSAVTAALRSGRLDVAGVPFDVVDNTFRNNDDFAIIEQPSTLVSFDINTTRPPFTDIRVRRAILMAIDWKNMGKNTRGKINSTSLLRPDITPAALTEDELAKVRPYDPQRARQLLAEAGYPNGFTTTVLVQKLGDADVREGEWIVADLEKVGIHATIEVVDPGTAITRRRDHQFALSKAARAVIYPDQTIQDYRTGSAENYAAISDPKVDQMIADSRRTLDENARNEIYRNFQRYMESDVAASVLPIQYYQFWVVNRRVQGYVQAPIYQGRRYADMWVTD